MQDDLLQAIAFFVLFVVLGAMSLWLVGFDNWPIAALSIVAGAVASAVVLLKA